MRDVSLRQLRSIVEIARTGRITAAAAALGLTPPAVTLQLRLLEQSLGLVLFERRRGGMVATLAGERLIDAAGRVAAVLQGAEQELATLRGLSGGQVTVGIVSTAKYFAPAALGAFHKRHPAIEIRLQVGNRSEIIAGLARLELDMAIMGLPPEHLETIAATLGEHPHVIIAPPDHRLARRTRVPLDALAAEPILVREPASGTRMLMSRVFEEAAISPPIAMEMSSNETIKQAVMAGLGIAFLSGHTIATEVDLGRLVILDVVGLPARRQWQVVRHADKRPMPAATALWEFLEHEGRSFLPPVLKHRRS